MIKYWSVWDRSKVLVKYALPSTIEEVVSPHKESILDIFLGLFFSIIILLITFEFELVQYRQLNEFVYKFTSAISPHIPHT